MRRDLVLCLLLSAICACSGETGGAGAPAEPGGAAQAAADVDLGAEGRLVARVGQGGVTEEQFVELALRNPAVAQGDVSPELRKEILDRLVTEEALWQEAMARGLYRDPKVRKLMVNQLLRQAIYANVTAGDFSPEELRAYFEAHRDEFSVPEKVQAKRIFLRVGPNRSREEAMNLAAKIRQDLLQQPDRFKELAVQYSDGPFKRRGGDLGYISREGRAGIDKAVVDMAFQLEVGQISQPFEAAGGVNLVTVAARRDRVERTFEHMKGSVLRRLKNERYKELTAAFEEEIKGKYTVTVDEELLSSVDLAGARQERMGAAPPEGEPAAPPAEEE